MGFSTPSYDLIDLFNRIDRGDLQLPDFQREYRWDIDHIRSLLVTVLRGYPMGALLALDTRNEPMRFRPRPLAGAPDLGVDPGLLLLDGQQRMTTLYHCLRGNGIVDTIDHRNKRIRRQFYVDIARAQSADIMPDEAVISVDDKGRIRSHYARRRFSTITSDEQAVAQGLMPVRALLSDEGSDLLFDLAASDNLETRTQAKTFHNTIAKPLVRYAVPMIRLDRDTAQGGIGSIFAQVNSAGLNMGIFDLLTAVFATEDPTFSLAEDYATTQAVFDAHPNLASVTATDWLMAVSLYLTGKQGYARGQREDILRMTLADYQRGAARMREAFAEAATFLTQRCILDASLVPYPLQIVPLAVILALLGDHSDAPLANTRAWDRINRWFWCGIFGELYGGPSVISRAARDVIEVTDWIMNAEEEADADASASVDAAAEGAAESATAAADAPVDDDAIDERDANEPGTVRDATFVESRLLSATPRDGLYKGIYALIMGRGARDWRTGETFDSYTFDELDTDFHPIFPRAYCHDHGIDPTLAASVINRTPMGRRTEVVLGGFSPARYLPRVQAKSLMEDDEFDAVLATHLLDPELLHRADADAFFTDRREKLLGMIEYAIGCPARRDISDHDPDSAEQGPHADA